MKSSFAGILLTVWCGAANAQLAEHVDRIAHDALSGPSAGMSVAVARGGRTILARGYGLANVEDSVAVTPETVFHIDSISKNILAAAVLQLVDEGKLSLDDDVTASLCNARMIVPHLATGYAAEGGVLTRAPFISWSLAWSAGSVCATATDLLTWEAALDSGRVVPPETLALMRTPTTVADGTKIDYGFGTRLGAFDGRRIVGHTGSGGGFRSVLMSFPDDHLTIAVLMNMDNPSQSPLAVAAQIAREALGITPKPMAEQPVPPEELAELAGVVFDSDDGHVENFAGRGKAALPRSGREVRGRHAPDRTVRIRRP